jgi:NAD dependent epimerase/dehydratase family enzyme
VRVLVTGASGFIGSALCDALLARGDSVVGLSRDPQRARSTNPSVVWHAWEPTLERPPANAFENVDGVVNLEGEKINQRWSEQAKRRIMESRRTGTHNLIAAIAGLEKKPRVLVNQSAIGFYGDRGDAMVDESAASGEGYDAEVVREWEAAAGETEGTGVRLVIVRTGHVPWIHIDDEVGILLWALDNEKVSGVVNSTAPNPVTNREFSHAIGRALGRPASVPVPGFVLDLKFGGEFGQVLRGGQRVMPRRALDLGYEFRYPEIDGALKNLL